jgi:hypothetical protein
MHVVMLRLLLAAVAALATVVPVLPRRQQVRRELLLLVAQPRLVRVLRAFRHLVRISWVEMDADLQQPETAAVAAAAVILAAAAVVGAVLVRVRSMEAVVAVRATFTPLLQFRWHSNAEIMVCGKTFRIH